MEFTQEEKQTFSKILRRLQSRRHLSLVSYYCESATFETVHWLVENGCELRADAITNAAFHGNLELVKWLRQNGCPWESTAIWWANRQGHVEVTKWLYENKDLKSLIPRIY